MKIALGSDHGGFKLKEEVKKHLQEQNIEIVDYGTDSEASVDYPEYGEKVGRAVASGECEKGIIVCGTGIGISISANKVDGVIAALCHDTFSARMTRMHNNSNILAMGERVIGVGLALDIVDTWLKTDFEGGRHERRVEKIKEIEKN